MGCEPLPDRTGELWTLRSWNLSIVGRRLQRLQIEALRKPHPGIDLHRDVLGSELWQKVEFNAAHGFAAYGIRGEERWGQ